MDLRRHRNLDERAFWLLFDTRHPTSGPWKFLQPRNRQRHVAALGLTFGVYYSEAKNLVGVFFSKDSRNGVPDPTVIVDSIGTVLAERLAEQPWTPGPSDSFHSVWEIDVADEKNWPAMCDWMVTEAQRFEGAVRLALATNRR